MSTLKVTKAKRFVPGFFRVAYNTYIDWYRREKRQVHTSPDLMASLYQVKSPGPEECYQIKESFNHWLKAVRSLPEKSRQIIILRDYHDFSYQEISNILDISLANVKVALFRSRQKINEVIKNEL